MNRTSTKIEKLSALIMVSGVLLFSACKKDRGAIIDPVPNETQGIYVLNEGTYNVLNSSELTYYNVATGVATQNYSKSRIRVLPSARMQTIFSNTVVRCTVW